MWGTVCTFASEGRRGGEPARIAPGDFQDLYGIGAPHGPGIQRRFLGGNRDEPSRASITRSMVHPRQVVINRFGDADENSADGGLTGGCVHSMKRLSGIVPADHRYPQDVVVPERSNAGRYLGIG